MALLLPKHQRLQVLKRLAQRATPSLSTSVGRQTQQQRTFAASATVGDGVPSYEYATLHDLQVGSCKTFPNNDLMGTYKAESGAFEWMTYEEFAGLVDTTRDVLRETGIGANDKVGVISNNRWEWAAVAAASYSLNATMVPMYEAQRPSDWEYILNDSRCATVFCATASIFDKVQKQVLPNTPSVQACLSFDPEADFGGDDSMLFSTAIEKASSTGSSPSSVIPPTADDLANLIYTSGTTGKPKGVELTHRNMAHNVQAGIAKLQSNDPTIDYEKERSLAFLPWAHSYGQTCELWGTMSQGGSMGICRGIPDILEDLQLVQPTVLFSVPTLYKKVYDGVHAMLEDPGTSSVRRGLIRQALQLGRKKNTVGLSWTEGIQFNLLNRVVLSKIRQRFGGNLNSGFVAGAACPKDVVHFMDDIGIPICEGYGLTETSPIIALCTPNYRKIGSVGQSIHDVKVYIMKTDGSGEEAGPGEEGEICCVGPNVMRGYHNKPEATDEVISMAPDGVSRMFHTGDVGTVDEDGFISVTGRIKEQYKLENGKYVVPTPVEEAIAMSSFIEQVVLYGTNRPNNVAILVLNEAAIAVELKTKDWSMNQLRTLIDAEIAARCASFKKYEAPVSWAAVDAFTVENNMLTPKMSIRRHQVVKNYQDVIAVLYDEDSVNERVIATGRFTREGDDAAAAATKTGDDQRSAA